MASLAIASACHLIPGIDKKSVQSLNHAATRRRLATKLTPRAALESQNSPSTATLPPKISQIPIPAPSNAPGKSPYTIKCVLQVQKKTFLDLINVFADLRDDIADIFGRKVRIQLISEDIDPDTGYPKVSTEVPVPNWIWSHDGFAATRKGIEYSMEFTVDKDFGPPGAFLIRNQHPTEFILKVFKIILPDGACLDFNCDSWVYPTSADSPRIFFVDKLWACKDTPPGLRGLRERAIQALRGGESVGQPRVAGERIYGYDVYNDLGDPDSNKELLRPVLGGRKLPYPRRVRTGRPPTKTDEQSESLPSGLDDSYVPVDEEFRRVKNSNFLGDAIKAFAHQIKPGFPSLFGSQSKRFETFKELYDLYDRGIDLGSHVKPDEQLIKEDKIKSPFTLINQLTDTDRTNNSLLKYPVPGVISTSRQAWISDDEFARQTIAGLNPLSIRKMETFPPTSQLDVETYGAEASALRHEHIESQLEGLTVQEAIEKNKLFILDFHDIFLPYLDRINAQEGKKMHATRTILFLNATGILKAVAIELSLPPPPGTSQRINRVLVPPVKTRTKDWVWELAKVHVGVNDSGFHQLISHWLRTHACMEPFIIATHRQLSVLHPINNLLIPHFKDTMSINSKARRSLINAGGIIEENFGPGKYSMEMSAVAYGLLWRFDQQALPTDLISRGLATPNPNAKHGLELTIPDYPFAVDGLNLWSTIKNWVTEYTDIFYPDDAAVQGDPEIQKWWHEIVNVGHRDKRNAEGWPEMKSKAALVEAVTTIIWIGSGHHAAVNFGQYAFSGFPPNRPSIAHALVPTEGTKEYKELMANPEKFYLATVSSKAEATTIMTTVELLSTHMDEEEYLGCERLKLWTSNQTVRDAYAKFHDALKDLEDEADARNDDPTLHNRRGPVRYDYTLLHITSGPGITGRGVPNSISI